MKGGWISLEWFERGVRAKKGCYVKMMSGLNRGSPFEKYRELGQGEEWELGVLGGGWGGERELCWHEECRGITVRLIRSWWSEYPQSI